LAQMILFKLPRERIQQEIDGVMRTRPMARPVYDPVEAGNHLATIPWIKKNPEQMTLLDESAASGKE